MADKKNTNNKPTLVRGFAAIANMDVLKEAMTDDCQGLDFTFDRIKFPSTGGTAFGMPAADGELSEPVREIRGVIVYSHPAFAYYAGKYTGKKNPPDCGSFDGVNGTGNPGGRCASCPFNKFGSAREGQGKLCKNKRMLYILQEGELFPAMLSIPAGSLKVFTQYVKSNLSKGRRLNQIVTRISLRFAANSDGMEYTQAVFSFERLLEPTEQTAVAAITETTKDYAAKLTPTAMADFNDDAPSGEPITDYETGEIIRLLN